MNIELDSFRNYVASLIFKKSTEALNRMMLALQIIRSVEYFSSSKSIGQGRIILEQMVSFHIQEQESCHLRGISESGDKMQRCCYFCSPHCVTVVLKLFRPYHTFLNFPTIFFPMSKIFKWILSQQYI